MLVIVKMKDGRMYEGIKCGTETGLVFLVNAWELTKDERTELMPGEHMKSRAGQDVYTGMGEKARIIQIPIGDVEIIESTN